MYGTTTWLVLSDYITAIAHACDIIVWLLHHRKTSTILGFVVELKHGTGKVNKKVIGVRCYQMGTRYVILQVHLQRVELTQSNNGKSDANNDAHISNHLPLNPITVTRSVQQTNKHDRSINKKYVLRFSGRHRLRISSELVNF